MALLTVLIWYGVVLLLAGLAVPVVGWSFPDWPDRGTSLAPAVGLGTVTVTAFWIGHLSFGPAVLVAGVAVLAVGGVLAARRGPGVVVGPALVPLAVFTATFALMLVVRGVRPGIGPYAGEQFLDFGLIHAVRRTEVLPPRDVWFAAARLRYYYGGPLSTALLTWLTDTPPRIAYNLMLPTVFASLSTAAYGIAGAVADDRDYSPRVAGLLGTFIVAFAGPVATALRALSSYLPRDVAAEYGAVLYEAISADTYLGAVEAGRYLTGDGFYFWRSRSIIPDTPSPFPLWTFVGADLRPHMYAGPFLLLAAGIAFACYRAAPSNRRRRAALLFGALPAVGGLLGFTNTFDLPVVAGLAFLALLFGEASPATAFPAAVTDRVPDHAGSPVVGELRRVGAAAVGAAVVGALSVLWASPFLFFHTATNDGIALLGPTTELGGLLLVYGGFLAAFALGYLPPVIEDWSRRRRVALVAGFSVGVTATTLVGYPAVGLFVPLVVGGWWLVRTGRNRGFDVVLAVAGAGLLLVPEFAYVAVWPYDPAAPRWNTIYKVAMQAWVLWGVAGAVAVTRALARARRALSSRGWIGLDRRQALAVATVFLLVSMAAFPAFALVARLDGPLSNPADADLSLNATGYLWESRGDRMASARWLRTETSGQPTMVSKPTNVSVYSFENGANVPSTFSGVPTVAGWKHAAGYHGLRNYRIAIDHVVAIYRGNWSVARNSLLYLDVEYVYVGPAEREAYGHRNFASLSPAIDVAYRRGNVTIYHVNQTALGGSE